MLEVAPWLGLVLLLIGQRVLDALAFRVLALPQRCYHTGWILGAGVGRWRVAALVMVLVGVPGVAGALGAGLEWSALDPSGWLRVVFGAAIGTIAWSTAGQSRNHYYGRWHVADRALIVASCAVCAWTPAAAPAALVACVSFVMQLNYPHGVYHSWTEKRPLYEALVLLSAAAWLGVWVRVEGWMLVVGVGAIVATAYVYPALSKLRLGGAWTWMLRNRMEALTVSSAHKGWMWWWSVERVARLARGMSGLRVALQVGTMALEVGALAVLVDARAGAVVLAGLVLMHTGIFAASGVAFWKWVILDVTLAAALWWMPGGTPANSWWAVLIGLGAVGAARWCGHTLPLGWLDGPVVGMFVLEAETGDGGWRRVAPLTMRPYDLAFGQARFHFLIDEPQVAGSFGILCRPLDVVGVERELRESGGDAARVEAIARAHGTSKRDAGKSAAFLRGLAQYFRNRNALIARGGWRARVGRAVLTPPHLWMGARGAWLRGDERVRSLVIRWVEVWHWDGRVRVLADREVARVDVEGGEAAGPGVCGDVETVELKVGGTGAGVAVAGAG